MIIFCSCFLLAADHSFVVTEVLENLRFLHLQVFEFCSCSENHVAVRFRKFQNQFTSISNSEMFKELQFKESMTGCVRL